MRPDAALSIAPQKAANVRVVILNGQKTVDGVKDSKFANGRIVLQYGPGVVKDKGVVKLRKVEIKPR